MGSSPVCAYPSMERNKSRMSMEDFRHFVGKTKEYLVKKGRSLKIDLTPIVGDPFADNYLFQRLEYLQQVGATRISFVTNAIGMSPAKVDRLLDFQLGYPGRLKMSVSIGGFDRETYHKAFGVDSFDRVTSNLTYLVSRKKEIQHGLPILINPRCHPDRMNGPFYETLLKYAKEGWVEFADVLTEYGNWGGKIDEQAVRNLGLSLAPKPTRFSGPCSKLFFHGVVITNDGTVNACACRDVEVTLPLGNLRDSSLEDILTGTKRRALIDNMMEGRFPDFCSKCSEYKSIFNPTTSFYKQHLKPGACSSTK